MKKENEEGESKGWFFFKKSEKDKEKEKEKEKEKHIKSQKIHLLLNGISASSEDYIFLNEELKTLLSSGIDPTLQLEHNSNTFESKSEIKQEGQFSHTSTQIVSKRNKAKENSAENREETRKEMEGYFKKRTQSDVSFHKKKNSSLKNSLVTPSSNEFQGNENNNENKFHTLHIFDEQDVIKRRRRKIRFLLESEYNIDQYAQSEEVKLFRNFYSSCADAFVSTVQDDNIYTYSPMVAYDIYSITTFLFETIVIKCYFPNGFEYAITTSLKLNMKSIIGEIIASAISLIPKEYTNPDIFLAKLCGLMEFLYLDVPLEFFSYIRDFLKKNSEAPIEIVLLQKTSELETELANSEIKHKQNINIFDNPSVQISVMPNTSGQTISHLDIGENLFISIKEIQGLNNFFPALNGDMLDYVYFEMGIYHGGYLFPSSFVKSQIIDVRSSQFSLELIKSQSSTEKHLSTISTNSEFTRGEIPPLLKCCCNLISGMGVWSIPRGARICLTLFGQSRRGTIFPIGWVGINLVNFNGIFVRAPMTLRLWGGEVANPIGICGEKLNRSEFDVSIQIEFTTFARQPNPVMFGPLILKDQEQKIQTVSDPPTREEVLLLDKIAKQDSLYCPTSEEHELLWEYRYYLRNKPQILAKLLIGIPWDEPPKVAEVFRILKNWVPLMAVDALELLDAKFACAEIRAYAVDCLSTIDDLELKDYLLQLVQALKHEPYHDSALARFLLNRALRNRQIGQLLFWLIKSQLHVAEFSIRYQLILESYLRGIPESHLDELIKQVEVVNKLTLIGKEIKEKSGTGNITRKKEILMLCLNDIVLPPTFSLPLNPSIILKGLIKEECKVMDSAKSPLWLVFENEDRFAGPVKIMFKMGDDLRQDMLTLEMFRIMDRLWKREGLDLGMFTYACICTGENQGMIEIVPNAKTVGSIQKELGVGGVFVRESLSNWLKQKVKQETYEQITENFAQSCAAYCVATYLLGIGDRHNDNIMVTTTGHLFHIDFGHFLGNVKKWAGISREQAPFILTPSFVHVMDSQFETFIETCCRCYIIIRRNVNIFMNLFAMMLSTGIPELQSHEDIKYLRKTFCLELNPEEANKFFTELIHSSLNTKTTQINFFFHNLVH